MEDQEIRVKGLGPWTFWRGGDGKALMLLMPLCQINRT